MARKLLIALVLIAAIAIAGIFVARSVDVEPPAWWPWAEQTDSGQDDEEALPVAAAPEPLFPVPEPAPAGDETGEQPPVSGGSQPAPEPVPVEPLPALDASDAQLQAEAAARGGNLQGLLNWAIVDGFIRRAVVTVDNLDDSPVARRFRAVEPVEGRFQVEPDADGFRQTAESQRRYAPLIAAAAAADPQRAAGLYLRFYPLFQAAYEDIAEPDAYFNDRLVEIIDHLLATPDTLNNGRLIRPAVYYQYADPATERRSWGQKALLRLPADARRTTKDQLRAFRTAIISAPQDG